MSTPSDTAKLADADRATPSHSLVTEKRDYSMFDAELSGAVLNMSLLGRILSWMRPYRITFMISALLVLVWSTLHLSLIHI